MPSTTKRIICLANSYKVGGRCIAGKEILPDGSVGEWIRPVSSRPKEGVSEIERHYEGEIEPAVLDVIEVPLISARPKMHQQENWLLDPDIYWEKVDRRTPTSLQRLADPVAPLWMNGYSSSNGENDRIPGYSINNVKTSLRLIRLPKLELQVTSEYGRKRVRGRFQFSRVEHCFSVTDPRYLQNYQSKYPNSYNIEECFLTISIGELYRGYYYKLIAAIIEPN